MSNPEMYKVVNLNEDVYKDLREKLLFQCGYNEGIIPGLRFHHKILHLDRLRKRYLRYKAFVSQESEVDDE